MRINNLFISLVESLLLLVQAKYIFGGSELSHVHAQRWRGGGVGGGGGYLGFQVTGMIEGFVGVFDRKI